MEACKDPAAATSAPAVTEVPVATDAPAATEEVDQEVSFTGVLGFAMLFFNVQI